MHLFFKNNSKAKTLSKFNGIIPQNYVIVKEVQWPFNNLTNQIKSMSSA